MARKGTVKLQFNGPMPCNTPYGKMNPGDSKDVDGDEAEDMVKRNPRLWKIGESEETPTKKSKGGKK
jgi:hypothetical protein